MTTRNFGNESLTYSSQATFGANNSYGRVCTTFADADGAPLNKIVMFCRSDGSINAKGLIYTYGGTLLGISDVVNINNVYEYKEFNFSTEVLLSANTDYLLGVVIDGGFYVRFNNDQTINWLYGPNNYDNPLQNITPNVPYANNALVYGQYTTGVGPSVVFPETISKHIGVK